MFCSIWGTFNLGGHHESPPSHTNFLTWCRNRTNMVKILYVTYHFSIHSLSFRFYFFLSQADHLSVFLSSFLLLFAHVKNSFCYLFFKDNLHIYLLKHIIHIAMTIFYIPKYKRCWISVVICFLSHSVWNKFKVNNKNIRTTQRYCSRVIAVNFEDISYLFLLFLLLTLNR